MVSRDMLTWRVIWTQLYESSMILEAMQYKDKDFGAVPPSSPLLSYADAWRPLDNEV